MQLNRSIQKWEVRMAFDPRPTALGTTQSRPTAILVDGDSQIPRFYSDIVDRAGFHVSVATTAGDAVEILHRESVDLILTDIRTMEFIEFVRGNYPAIGVVVLTHDGTVEMAVEAIRRGVTDFITGRFDLTKFQQKLESWACAARLERTRQHFIEESDSLVRSMRLIGQSSVMREIQRSIEKAAQQDCPVLILGESGTGKELVAQSIHYSGKRSTGPFIPVDCASLTPSLIESELFGHEKGAFTGAHMQKPGVFEAAHNGTLFLDEIGELPKEQQSKLLRVLQEKALRRLGSTQTIPVNVRIIAATNRNLDHAVQANEFRQDLYYRLHVVELNLPPLRERKSDIPLLVAVFMEKHKIESRPIARVAHTAWANLLAHNWPGNVRELENTIESALALGSGPELETVNLTPTRQVWDSISERRESQVFALDILEKTAVLAALRETQGDKQAAARILGLGKTTLYRKLKQYGSAAHASA
jgi:DNA-binding NtrC family response regulator